MARLNANNNDYIETSNQKIVDEIIRLNTDDNFKVNALKYNIKNVSELALEVSKNLKKLTIEEVMNTSFKSKCRVLSTLKFKNDKIESENFKRLKEEFRYIVDELNISPGNKDLYYEPVRFRDNNLGITSSFSETNSIVKKIDYINDGKYKKSLTRQDIVEIFQDMSNIEEDIEKSLIDYYSCKFKNLDEDELEEVIDCIKNRDLLTNKIRDYIIIYRDGYLKRLVEGPIYLNFIKDAIDSQPEKKEGFEKGYKLFANYIKRINDFENFVQDSIVNDGDNMYHIEYKNTTLDFIHSIKTQLVYEWLPFSGIITSPLSDTRDEARNNGHEVYGLSLKRNGKVMTENINSSFEYHLKTLCDAENEFYFVENEKGEEEKKKYELKTYGIEFIKAILFKCILENLESDSYDAISVLKEDLLKYKKSGLNSDEKIRIAIGELICNIEQNKNEIMSQLNDIKCLLNTCISNNDLKYKKTYVKKFSLLNSILPKSEDLDDGILLDNIKEKKNYNKLFKYTTLLDEDIDEDVYTYSYDYNITLTTNVLSVTEDFGKIKVEFDREYFNPFSIIFYPTLTEIDTISKEKAKSILATFIKDELIPRGMSSYPAVFMNYYNGEFESESQRFIYETSYTFIVTVLTSLITDKLSLSLPLYQKKSKECNDEEKLKYYKEISDKTLYVMPIQLTFNKEFSNKPPIFNKSQSFVRILRKCIASSLSEKHISYSQGFNVLGNKQKVMNSINSLYTKVHRVAELPTPLKHFKKMAIIVASSRKHANTISIDNDNYESTLLVEVMTINNFEGNKVKFLPYGEFSQYLSKDDLHKNPTILMDIVDKLEKMGYRDIVYLAHSPFNATMLEKKKKTEMYFMNEEVIKTMMTNTNNVNLYPLYINTCKIYGKEGCENNDIYMAPVKNMYDSIETEYEGIVPLFQLFSNNAINKSEDNFYTEMIVYSTIKGVYSNDVKGVSSDLLLKANRENNVILDLQNILTVMHIIRNEKYVKKAEYKTIKDNPFENIIDTSKSVVSISTSSYDVPQSRSKDGQFIINRFSLVSYIMKTINNC